MFFYNRHSSTKISWQTVCSVLLDNTKPTVCLATWLARGTTVGRQPDNLQGTTIMKFTHSSILTAFANSTIGSKVVDPEAFAAALATALESYDTTKDRAPGQHYVVLPESAFSTVSAGVGQKTNEAGDYVVRIHRGQATMFLRREKAASVEGLAVVVYTHAAYMTDPDVANDPAEIQRIGDATHIIVAVLASAGPRSPLTTYRLVHNLAGGNNEVATWTKEDIVAKAVESKDYWDKWEVVAD